MSERCVCFERQNQDIWRSEIFRSTIDDDNDSDNDDEKELDIHDKSPILFSLSVTLYIFYCLSALKQTNRREAEKKTQQRNIMYPWWISTRYFRFGLCWLNVEWMLCSVRMRESVCTTWHGIRENWSCRTQTAFNARATEREKNELQFSKHKVKRQKYQRERRANFNRIPRLWASNFHANIRFA